MFHDSPSQRNCTTTADHRLDRAAFHQALLTYQQRDRRFGAIAEAIA
jgi:replicative superfamily II helicase